MATISAIEWTEMTWNPVTGCSKVSEGCRHCYAERMAGRLLAMGNARYVNGFRVTLHDDLVDLPRRIRQPRMIFVNSMSDLFHELVPLERVPLEGINWVIVGGESGPGARPMKRVWVESIRRQCRRAGVSFFFKQWGGVQKGCNGRELNGRTYDELPAAAGAVSIRCRPVRRDVTLPVAATGSCGG